MNKWISLGFLQMLLLLRDFKTDGINMMKMWFFSLSEKKKNLFKCYISIQEARWKNKLENTTITGYIVQLALNMVNYVIQNVFCKEMSKQTTFIVNICSQAHAELIIGNLSPYIIDKSGGSIMLFKFVFHTDIWS